MGPIRLALLDSTPIFTQDKHLLNLKSIKVSCNWTWMDVYSITHIIQMVSVGQNGQYHQGGHCTDWIMLNKKDCFRMGYICRCMQFVVKTLSTLLSFISFGLMVNLRPKSDPNDQNIMCRTNKNFIFEICINFY